MRKRRTIKLCEMKRSAVDTNGPFNTGLRRRTHDVYTDRTNFRIETELIEVPVTIVYMRPSRRTHLARSDVSGTRILYKVARAAQFSDKFRSLV